MNRSWPQQKANHRVRRQMRTNKPIPPLVMERGHCKPIRDASSREFNYPQESLPEAIEILLCLLDGGLLLK
jgi:hypothetical protein